MSFGRAAIICGAMACVLAAFAASSGQTRPANNDATKVAPTAEEARKFIENAQKELFDLGVKASRASWV